MTGSSAALSWSIRRAELRAAPGADHGELYRALWIQDAAFVGTQIAIAGIIVALVKLL